MKADATTVQGKTFKTIESTSMQSLIDSDLFAVLAWKSKYRTLKYVVLTLTACVLSTFYNVSVTVMLLTAILVLRGPRMLLQVIRARRASKSEEGREEWENKMKEAVEKDDLELISEDHLAQLVIAVYLLLNSFFEMVREIIEFQKPLMCFAKSLIFLGMSAIVTLIGDMNLIWASIFLSFLVPPMLKKRESKGD